MRFIIFSFLLAIFIPFITVGQDYQKAKYLIEIEQFSNARKLLNEKLKANPGDAIASFYIGESYFSQQMQDSAKLFYTKGIEADPKNGLNYVGLGKLISQTNEAEGKAQFDKALSLAKSRDLEVPYAIAEYYVTEKKDGASALTLIEGCMKYHAKNPELLLLAGDAYFLQNNGNAAIEHYERKALPLNENLPKTYLKIGRLYSRTRNYDVAMKYYNQAIEKDAQYAPAYKEIAEVYYKAGLYQKAINAYDKYLGIADKDSETDFRYASFLFLNKEYQKTIDLLTKIAVKNTENPIYYRVLGYSYYETGDYDKGLTNIETFFKKAKDDQILSSDYEYLGKIQMKKGSKDLAVENFKKALEKDPANTDLYIELGNIYFLDKNFKEAADAYEGKLNNVKGTPNDYLNYGKMLYYNQDFKKADSAFSILAEQIPNMIHGHLWRAKACEQIDPEMKEGLAAVHYEKFAEIAEKEREKNKADLINAYSYLGSWYSLKGDTEKSATAWKKVKELDPANKNAQEALKNYK